MRTHSFRDSIDIGFVRFVGNVMFYVRQHESKQIAKNAQTLTNINGNAEKNRNGYTHYTSRHARIETS